MHEAALSLLGSSDAERDAIAACIADLARVSGIDAVVLGGSRVVGLAHDQSDVDLVCCYRDDARFELARVDAIVQSHAEAPRAGIAGFGVWGPWVDGGAWISIAGRRVDLLWRSLDHYACVVAEALAGRHDLHFGQQGPFGYLSTFALGEIVAGRTLEGDASSLAQLRALLDPYPEPLRAAVVRDYLWEVEFGLGTFAVKADTAGDVVALVGCLARYGWRLRHVLLAHLRQFAIGDRHALALVAQGGPRCASIMQKAESAVVVAAGGDGPRALALLQQALAETRIEVGSSPVATDA